MVDRGGRSESLDELDRILRGEIKKLDLDSSKLGIGASDRVAESWMLANHNLMIKKFGKSSRKRIMMHNIEKITEDLMGRETKFALKSPMGWNFLKNECRRGFPKRPIIEKFHGKPAR